MTQRKLAPFPLITYITINESEKNMVEKEFEIATLFPIPVYVTKRETELTSSEMEDIKDLIEKEKWREKKSLEENELIKRTEDGTYIFDTKLDGIKKFCEEHIDTYVNEVITPKNKELDFYITQSWLNVTKPGEWHHNHSHATSIISGVFYVSTGEANTALMTYRESSSRGIGIWRSLEGGDSWELLASTSEFEYVTDISIKSTENSSEIYASVVSGAYQGQDHESSPSDGLFRSSDNGETWEQVLPNIPGTNIPYSPSDIEITSSGKIFVGTMKNLNGDGGATILSSLTGDIGSWSINSDYQNIIEGSSSYNIPGRVVISSCESAPEVLYAVIGSGFINNMGFNLSYGNYIIKSLNAGDNWESINLPGIL